MRHLRVEAVVPRSFEDGRFSQPISFEAVTHLITHSACRRGCVASLVSLVQLHFMHIPTPKLPLTPELLFPPLPLKPSSHSRAANSDHSRSVYARPSLAPPTDIPPPPLLLEMDISRRVGTGAFDPGKGGIAGVKDGLSVGGQAPDGQSCW